MVAHGGWKGAGLLWPSSPAQAPSPWQATLTLVGPAHPALSPAPPGEVFHIPLSSHPLQEPCLIAPCRLRYSSSGLCPTGPGAASLCPFPTLSSRAFPLLYPELLEGRNRVLPRVLGPGPRINDQHVGFRTRAVLRMGVGSRARAGGWSSHPPLLSTRTSFGRWMGPSRRGELWGSASG